MILRTIGSISLIVGETREVFVDVRNASTPTFEINRPAYWTLAKRHSDEIEEQGDLQIIGDNFHTLKATISPQKKGVYYLVYTFHIADETIKVRAEVKVS